MSESRDAGDGAECKCIGVSNIFFRLIDRWWWHNNLVLISGIFALSAREKDVWEKEGGCIIK